MNPLNSSCYMWWDELAPYGQTDRKDLQAIASEMIGVMERTLALESDACRESALHGLGHAHGADPERINRIIDAFLERGEIVSTRGRNSRSRRRTTSTEPE